MNGDPNPDDGSDYDHIVPVYGFTTNHAVNDPTYYADDTILFTDDGLWDASDRS